MAAPHSQSFGGRMAAALLVLLTLSLTLSLLLAAGVRSRRCPIRKSPIAAPPGTCIDAGPCAERIQVPEAGGG